MATAGYRLDWKRPASPVRPGERNYRATNGARHILVVMTDRQLDLAHRLAGSMRRRDPEFLAQGAVEEAIAAALVRGSEPVGTLRLLDSDSD
jgi:hypothetical protein